MNARTLKFSRGKNGFTLLEILVVLAILGLGLSLVTSLTTATSKQSERVEEETTVALACQNWMNEILAGDATVSIGAEIPIPDAPNWSAVVELVDGPIENLVAIRITARRFGTVETPSTTEPNAMVVARLPDRGRRIVIKEWARRADVKTRTIQTNLDGTLAASDSTADADKSADGADANGWNSFGSFGDSNVGGGLNGGGFGATSASPFSAVDAALGNNVGGGLNSVPVDDRRSF